MSDLRTISPDELPELSEIPEGLRALVFSPNGPLQAVPYEQLLTKLIATNLAKATKALLDAELAHPADSVALVFGDPTSELNGWYRKLGASGAGSWQQFEELARAVRAAATASADAAAASADEAGSLVASLTLGNLMEDILALPLLPDLQGSEFVAVVKDGVPYRTTLAALSDYLGGEPSVPAPSFTVQPSITGEPNVGAVLIGNVGTIVNGSAVLTAWRRGSAIIPDADGLTYTLSDDDLGELISFRVEAGGPGGSAIATSAAIGPVTTQRSITGTRLAIMGDSRSDNGLTAQSGVAPTGFQTGVPEATRLQGIHGWLLHAMDWPMEIVGQWTQGGCKTSQCFHDHALEIIAARLGEGDAAMILVGTNDPVDYTGTGGLLPIPLGDPNAPPASQPRVGDRAPVGSGIGQQGTSIGNYDKAIRFFGARGIRVIAYEIPTENSGRRQRNIDLHLWLRARAADGTYPNLIAPDVFTPLLSDPGNLASDVRTDIEATVGILDAAGDGGTFLHPSPACARFCGETMAEDPAIVAAFAGLTSLSVLPDGTNDAAFINANPTVSVGDGSGVLGYMGSSSPAPTGTVAQGYELGHNVSTGTIAVAASFSGGEQVITISRTGGGADATIPRTVELRGTAVNITPVAGDVYVLEAEIVAPARDPQDLFAVFPHIFFQEGGLLNDYAQDISTGTYGAFNAQNPNYFPKNGDTLVVHSVPFEITPAMVASATGTIALSTRCSILFSDAMNTVSNGNLAVTIKSMGIRKLEGAYSHTTAPTAPAAGAACTVAPVISGSLFVGGTITLTNGTFASGTIASRRLLRDGVSVSFTGSTYTLTEADNGKRFVFENTSSTGTIAQSAAFGPIGTPSAELVALIGALGGVQNNGIYDFTDAAVVSTVWRAEDLLGNGNTAAQSAATRQPGIDPALGATLDGTNDTMGFNWQTAAPTTATVVIAMRKAVGHTGGRIISDGTTTNADGQYANGGTTALIGTWTVDGASVTNQGQLFTALNDGLEHTVMVTGLNVSAWPGMFFSRLTGAVSGSMRRGVVIAENTTNLAAARTAAIAFVQSTT